MLRLLCWFPIVRYSVEQFKILYRHPGLLYHVLRTNWGYFEPELPKVEPLYWLR